MWKMVANMRYTLQINTQSLVHTHRRSEKQTCLETTCLRFCGQAVSSPIQITSNIKQWFYFYFNLDQKYKKIFNLYSLQYDNLPSDVCNNPEPQPQEVENKTNATSNKNENDHFKNKTKTR